MGIVLKAKKQVDAYKSPWMLLWVLNVTTIILNRTRNCNSKMLMYKNY